MSVSVKKNKINEVTKSLYDEANKQAQAKSAFKRKLLERSLMLLALVGSIAVATLFVEVLTRMNQSDIPKNVIYGTWVEQKVAHYAKDEFVLSERGVSVSGSIVATDFKFDGNHFEYNAGDKTYRFRMINAENTEMILDSDGYYNPLFKLEGSENNALR
ncbi:DUF2850 domain-containing protein [Vibrio sp. 99-70-13A1]|uniref:DUF2850 domain-containing protein n=1 Tax=Vibrio sp. 99-70-13A1 TaxID=2607601 RepID=UPI0014932F0E|nr:DUF2850 domain-containing protein [Vibrio sp. 99-70-13A1]NOH98025.1 DUF2850 domain-containing protein [Vibrio sp. 99-70-13A1]